MGRKVSVGLEADVAGFIGPIHESARATEKLDDKIDDLDHSLNRIPLDSAKAAAALKLLNGDVKDVGTHVGEIGDKSTSLNVLDQRIRSTRSEVKKLTDEFIRTGSVDVFHKLGTAQGELGELTNIRKKLSNSVENGLKDGVAKAGPESASTFSQLFEGGIINAFKNPYVLAAAGVLAAAVGPLIGSAIGGAVIAAGAVGAVALGVAGAATFAPQRIGAAWGAEIAQIKAEWLDASMSFVGPTEKAIHILGQTVAGIHLDAILGKASGFVEPLARGAAEFTAYIAHGVEMLTMKAGPIVQVLREELPEVGHSIDLSLSMIAGGNRGAADGLRDILHLVEAIIVGFGGAIRFTEDWYHGIKGVGEAIRGVTDQMVISSAITEFFDPEPAKAYAVSLDGAAHGIDKTAEAAQKAAPTLADLDSQLGKTEVTADSLAAKMSNQLFSAIMGIDQANLSWHESLLSLTDTLKENGRALVKHSNQLDLNSKKGQDNERAILGAVSANMQMYQANVAAGMSAEDAAAIYDQNTAALERQLKQAGYTSKQIEGLIGKYKGIPGKVNTLIAIDGLTEAINELTRTIQLIAGIKSKTVTVKVGVNTFDVNTGRRLSGNSRNPGDSGARGVIRMAEGGALVAPSNPGTFLFGEPQTGGEAFIPLRGISQSRAMGLAQVVGDHYGFGVSRWSGGGPMRFEHTIRVVDGSSGRSGLATLVAGMARTGELQITSRAIVN